MAYTNVWNETLPSGVEAANTIDDLMRSQKVDLRERLIDIFAIPDFTVDPLRPYAIKFTDATDAKIFLGDNAGTPRFMAIRNKADNTSFVTFGGAPAITVNNGGLTVSSGTTAVQTFTATTGVFSSTLNAALGSSIGAGVAGNGVLAIKNDGLFGAESAAGLYILAGVAKAGLILGTDETNTRAYIQSIQVGTSYVTRPLWINPNGGIVNFNSVIIVNGGVAFELNNAANNAVVSLSNSGASGQQLLSVTAADGVVFSAAISATLGTFTDTLTCTSGAGSGKRIIAKSTGALTGGFAYQTISGTRISDMNGSDIRWLDLSASSARMTLTDAGALSLVAGIAATTGTFSTSVIPSGGVINYSSFVGTGKIVGGTTGISIRNNADNADNVLVSDAGVLTTRAGITINDIAQFGSASVPSDSVATASVLAIATQYTNATTDVSRAGARFYYNQTALGTTNAITAMQAFADVTAGSGTATVSVGLQGISQSSAAGHTIAVAVGVRGQVGIHNGGTISDAECVDANPYKIGTGTITRLYGYYCHAITVGTNNWGLFFAGKNDAQFNGSGSALSTAGVEGFIHIANMPGPPSGTPFNLATGSTPLTYDTLNHKLWAYDGGTWKGVVLA